MSTAPGPGDGLSAWALGAAVFLSGAVLLGVEITASRVVAPTFGSSLYVWGSLIGVVLTGLSIGYWVGGVVADRFPTPYLLVGVMTLGAFLVLLIPLLDDWVLDQVVDWSIGPRADPLVASVLLFGPMSVALAAVSPIAVRLAARSIDRLGRIAGRLFSISTAGSIVGTFATAFFLVPELGTEQVLGVGVACLLVAALLIAASARLRAASMLLAAGAAGAVVLAVALAPEEGGRLSVDEVQNYSPLYRQADVRSGPSLRELTEGARASGYLIREARDTQYHRMLVVDDRDTRLLRFDSSFQSGMYLDDPYRTRFAYTDYLMLGLAYNPYARRVLFIGLGGGSAPKRLWRDFPNAEIDVAELDPAVVKAAYKWFALPRDDRLKVESEDGRRYLVKHDEKWDVIVIDSYHADSLPFHLTTAEFIELVRSRLAPRGVVVTNVIGALQGERSKLLRALSKTYRSVFPTVAWHPVYEGDERYTRVLRNVIVVAQDGALPSESFLVDRWAKRRAASPGAPNLGAAIRNRWNAPIPVADVPLLTDDYAPTDALLLF